MRNLWQTNSACYIGQHHVKPENLCSILIYLSEVHDTADDQHTLLLIKKYKHWHLKYSGTSIWQSANGVAKSLCYTEAWLYQGSFPYILLLLGSRKSYFVPRTSLYRGSLYWGSTVHDCIFFSFLLNMTVTVLEKVHTYNNLHIFIIRSVQVNDYSCSFRESKTQHACLKHTSGGICVHVLYMFMYGLISFWTVSHQTKEIFF